MTDPELIEKLEARLKGLEDLQNRVVELEQSNAALWAWIKALAGQDSMLLQFTVRIYDKSEEWAPMREKIINQIVDNDRKANDLPVPENDE